MKCWAWEYLRTIVAIRAMRLRPLWCGTVFTCAQPAATESAAPAAAVFATFARNTRRVVLKWGFMFLPSVDERFRTIVLPIPEQPNTKQRHEWQATGDGETKIE